MIGAEILIWGIEDNSHPFWSAIHHYLWDGNIGHCAFKLTIPSNPENDKLVFNTCICKRKGKKDKSRIPHLLINRKIGDKMEKFWVIYFSWWPRGKLYEEFNDRLSANGYLQVEYGARWQEHFPETMEPRRGAVRDYFGMIYDFIFGPPQPVPKPIESIVHSGPNTTVLTNQLQKKQADLAILKERILSKAETFFKINDCYEKLYEKNQRLANEPKSSTINALLNDTKRKLILVEKEINILNEEVERIWETHTRLSTELKLFKREYYHETATIGAAPQVISLPLGEHLSYEKLLHAMRKIATGSYSFDIIFNNCASAVREIVAAGLSEQAKNADFKPQLLDTPLKLYQSACALQKKLIGLRAIEDPSKMPILSSYRLAAAKAALLPVIAPMPESRWYLKPS